MGDARATGDVLAAVSNSIASLLHEYYGRGPENAKSYLVDNYLIVVMRGGLTTVEETLLEAGHDDLVRQVRLTFQAEMALPFKKRVAKLTGREVLGYQSQVIFDPVTLIEFFILEPED